MTQPRRVAMALAGMPLLAGCGGGPQPAAAPSLPAPTAASSPSTTPATASPSPTLSPSPSMNRKQACQQVVEGATDWIYLIARVSDDPSLQSVNSMELDQLSFKISETLPYLDRTTAEHAGKLVNPLTTLQSVMATGENLDVDLEEARDAVPDVLAGCRGKASLKGYDSPYNK